jgi:hypothetical protein
MTRRELEARDYCRSIGADPNEVVGGYWLQKWTYAERWSWYAR